MKWPSIRRQQSYTVQVPQLNGGVNYSVPPHMIADNQLSDVKNMWYKDGILQMRPAMIGKGYKKLPYGTLHCGAEKTGDKICVLSHKMIGDGIGDVDGGRLIFSFLNTEGEFVAERTIGFDISDFDPTSSALMVENSATVKGEDGNPKTGVEILAFVKGCRSTAYQNFVMGISSKEENTMLQPYIPTVLKNGRPAVNYFAGVSGDLFEPYNMLTGGYRCEYTTDGEGCLFFLPEKDFVCPKDEITVTYMNEKGITYTHVAKRTGLETFYAEEGYQENIPYALNVDIKSGTFYFVAAGGGFYTLPSSTVLNNLSITVYRENDENESRLYGMRFSTWFGGGSAGLTGGNRLFVSGNPEHPNLVHWSSLNNPLYFPENNYAYVGNAADSVTAFGKQGELLVIFKESEIYCTQYVQGSVTVEEIENGSIIDIETARAVFPMVQLHPYMGCDCPKTIRLCNNRLVWLNSDGKVYGLFTTGQYSERNVRELSHTIERKLKGHTPLELKSATAIEYESHYLLCVGDTTYAMDYSSGGFTYYTSYSSDERAQKVVSWYVWDFKGEEMPSANKAAVQHIIQVREKVIFLCYAGTMHYCVYMLENGERYDSIAQTESAMDENGNPSEDFYWYHDSKICTMFKTKLFEFNRPDVKKNIQQLYMGIGDVAESEVRISYVTEQGEREDAFTAVCTGEGEADENAFVHEWRLTPNISRVRLFGVRCESDGAMAVQGILLKYQHQGVVR